MGLDLIRHSESCLQGEESHFKALSSLHEYVPLSGRSEFAYGRSSASSDSECEVDGNAVKSTTATSVEQIQDRGARGEVICCSTSDTHLTRILTTRKLVEYSTLSVQRG